MRTVVSRATCGARSTLASVIVLYACDACVCVFCFEVVFDLTEKPEEKQSTLQFHLCWAIRQAGQVGKTPNN